MNEKVVVSREHIYPAAPDIMTAPFVRAGKPHFQGLGPSVVICKVLNFCCIQTINDTKAYY